MNDKIKIALIVSGIVAVGGISLFISIKSLKDANKTDTDVQVEATQKPDIDDINNKGQVGNVIDHQMNDSNALTTRFSLLNKYSEKYNSVADWMLKQIEQAITENGFTIDVDDGNGNVKEVDGFTKYKTAAEYLTECINNDTDINDLFAYYCPDLYNDLSYVYILGEDKNDEYPQSLSESTFNTLFTYYKEQNFEATISGVEDILKTYKLTMPYNYKICNLYQDAKQALDYGSDASAMKYGLSTVSLPETYLTLFLRLVDTDKLQFIKDSSSVVPFSNTIPNITNIREMNDKDDSVFFKQYADDIYDSQKVVEITYTDLNESDIYKAYIVCNYNYTYKLIKINYVGTGNCMYKTAAELMQTQSKR